jgi:hypothetical protein
MRRYNKMRHLRGFRYAVGLVAALALALSPMTAFALTTATVTIDVTPAFVSISTTNDTKDFGTVAAGLTNSTVNSTVNYFDVTNSGTVNATVTIKCDGWTHQTGSSDWTYGSPGADTGQLVFSVGTSLYDTVIPESPSTEALFAALVPSTPDYFEVGIDMPTSFTHGDKQRSVITLTATAA